MTDLRARPCGQDKTLTTKPKVDAFFEWVRDQFKRQDVTLSNPFTQALEYVRKRRLSLEVFLTDPDVPLDTITWSAL